MIKKIVFFLLLFQILATSNSAYALNSPASLVPDGSIYNLPVSPIACNQAAPSISCPTDFIGSSGIYSQLDPPETCAASYEDFLTDPISKHYWIEDPKITAQGKADERARQFLYWVLNTNAVDEAPVLRTIWTLTSTIAVFGIVLTAAIFGIGYIVNRRSGNTYNGIGNFFPGGASSGNIWPTIFKLGMMLLYVAFSAAIIFLLVQLSEILMRFFIDNLGGKDLFNIYFANPGNQGIIGSTEQSYKTFIGCRDLNIRVKESIDTQLIMLKLTNISYYVLGSMLLLRKILLWFLLFVSPFLAILLPFIFIRNTGWIWIGVFFQWLFYGPLVALFLGGMSKIWSEGIPFGFDFSRAGEMVGYIYPTAINIVYGGPAQRIASGVNRPIGALNNGSYIDTFVEYVITLLMLWAVTFFPWWLLRIFRDYCCEGIYAMKNILMALYDQMRGGPSGPSPSGGPVAPTMPSLKIDTKTPVNTNVNVSLGSLDKIRQTMSKDIVKSMNLQMTKITDIARLETNKTTRQNVNENLTLLSSPVKARIPAQRQQFMNLRSELFSRAIKNDTIARTLLSSTSTSTTEKIRARESIIRSIPARESLSTTLTANFHSPKEKLKTITEKYTESLVKNNESMTQIAKATNTNKETIVHIISSYKNHLSRSPMTIVKNISNETNTSQGTVREVLRYAGLVSAQSNFVQSIALTQKLSSLQMTKILEGIRSTVSDTTLEKTNTPIETILKFTQTEKQSAPQVGIDQVRQMLTQVANNTDIVTKISNQSATNNDQVKNILNTYSENIDQTSTDTFNTISSKTGIDQSKVQSVLQNFSSVTQNSPQIIENLSKNISLPKETVANILNTVSSSPISPAQQSITNIKLINQNLEKIETPALAVSKENITNIVNNLTSNQTLIQSLSEQTKESPPLIQAILQSFNENLNINKNDLVNQISIKTSTPKEVVQRTLNNVPMVISQNPKITSEISRSVGLPEQKIAKISQSLPQILQTVPSTDSAKPMAKVISDMSQVEETKSKNIIKSMMINAAKNSDIVNSLAKTTNLKTQQIENILNTYANNINQPTEKLIQIVNQSSGVPKDQVKSTISALSSSMLLSNNLVSAVASEEGIEESEVGEIMEEQIKIASEPEKNIEKTITIPQSISLEDYEEVKDMWIKHFEDGEVPISETIKSRRDWIEQEIVVITNTLNKILSDDEKLQQEGLDEVGFLLPIFLINNLKGEELIVYLKAKLEAAKSVIKLLNKEESVKSKLQKDSEDEVFVDIPAQKASINSKEMTFDSPEDEEVPQSIEDREIATQKKLSNPETNDLSLDDIKSKLNDAALKEN